MISNYMVDFDSTGNNCQFFSIFHANSLILMNNV